MELEVLFDVGGERGREYMSRKLVEAVKGMAVASDTAEKSGQGLEDGKTGRL